MKKRILGSLLLATLVFIGCGDESSKFGNSKNDFIALDYEVPAEAMAKIKQKHPNYGIYSYKSIESLNFKDGAKSFAMQKVMDNVKREKNFVVFVAKNKNDFIVYNIDCLYSENCSINPINLTGAFKD
ncbi:hypothetical protein KDE13_09225 [Campylobacter sp. faydin G-140]|uniref:hypothetical protein n=1 Tax=Campylobacter anatolicus TaxID=2829105 RepID=UPI001BA3AAAC|nr:hypothetical protein [Campylobacter anatolicus]MBR8466514.1 hypothetical protein [Campylobacter anatolicus]